MNRYSQFLGTFDTPSVAVSLEKALKRRLPGHSINGGLNIESKTCSDVHEIIRKQESGEQTGGSADDDDDFMKEFMREQMEKQEILDKELGRKKKKRRGYDDL